MVNYLNHSVDFVTEFEVRLLILSQLRKICETRCAKSCSFRYMCVFFSSCVMVFMVDYYPHLHMLQRKVREMIFKILLCVYMIKLCLLLREGVLKGCGFLTAILFKDMNILLFMNHFNTSTVCVFLTKSLFCTSQCYAWLTV